jgi:hypothetical protein
MTLIVPSPPAGAISFPLIRTTTLGQSVYPDIALHISNYYITYNIRIQSQYIRLLHIRIKSIHLISWTLSTWPSSFRDTDWDADIDQSQNVYRLVLPVYTRNLDRSISAYKIAVRSRFLDSLNNFCAFILCASDSDLQCNKHNSYWYVGQYQDKLHTS